MESYGDKIQALMDEFYKEWQKDENKSKSKWDILDKFSEAHQIAVVLGNFNYQVGNGGLEQWVYNGYFHEDADKLIDYLKNGSETDERCEMILDKIYKLDEYAKETDCDRYGNFTDEEGESCFICKMINCDEFDSWYYEKCDDENWWQAVCGIIEKAQGQEPDFSGRVESESQKAETINFPLSVYIENIHDSKIGGFTMPLPVTPEKLQPFFDDIEINGWQDMEIMEVMSDINGLGEILNEVVKKTMRPEALDELNYLAAKIQTLQSEKNEDIFEAAIETKRYNNEVSELINLTENINHFDLLPAFTNEQYGDFLIEQFENDEHADAFNKLESSDDLMDNKLAKYIEKLEKYVDRTSYGRDAIKEENGVLTKNGLLFGGDGMKTVYNGQKDIPVEYRIFTKPDEIYKSLMKLDNENNTATMAGHCCHAYKTSSRMRQ